MKLYTSWRRKRHARRLVADYGRGYIEAPRLSQPPPSAPPQPGIPTMNLLDDPMRAPERAHPVDFMGVIRQSFTITEEDAYGDDVAGELVGSLMLTLPEDQLVTGEFVIYTLGLDRLRDLLHMAAAGHDIDGLLLSLDAVALASDEDDNGPEPATGG